MKKIIIIILAILIIPSICFSATTVSLTVTEDQGVARTNYPVTIGFPMPSDSGETAVTNIMVTDNSDVEIASDRTITQRWTAAGNIRWLLLDFDATVSASSTATYKVVYAGSAAATYTDDVVVTTETNYYKVDAGDLEFKVSRVDSFKIYDVIIGAVTMVDSTDTWIAAHDVDGTEYNTDNANTYDVSIEWDGTERATILCTGTFEDSSNNEHFRHETRITAYGGEDTIKISQTVVFNKDMQDTASEPSKIFMITPLQIGASTTMNYAVGGETIETGTIGVGDDYHLTQWYYDSYEVGQDGETADQTGNQSDGWLDINDGSTGLTVIVPDLWERSPHKIDIDDVTSGTSVVHNYYWPDEDLTATVGEVEDLVEAGGSGLVLWPFQAQADFSLRARQYSGSIWEDVVHNAYGVAITWDSIYYFHAGTHTSATPTSEDTYKAFDKDLLAWNQIYATSTKVLGDIEPVNITDFAAMEEGFAYDWPYFTVDAATNYKLYGPVYYGTSLYDGTTYPPSLGDRYLAHGRSNSQRGFWEFFYRTGERKYYDWAKRATRLLMDGVYANDHGDFTDTNSNTVKQYDGGYGYMEVGAITWDSHRGYTNSGANENDKDLFASGMFTMYYMTGDSRAEDRGAAASLCNMRVESRNLFHDYPGVRGLSGTLDCAMSYYEYSNDSDYLGYARTAFTDWTRLGDNNYQIPNGLTDDAINFVFYNSSWSGLQVDWYNEVDQDATNLGYEEIWNQARSCIYEDGVSSNLVIYDNIFEALYKGHEASDNDEYIKRSKRNKVTWDTYAQALYDTAGAIQDWTRYMRSAIRWMNHFTGVDFDTYTMPDFPTHMWRIWQGGVDETVFYINATGDQEWNLTLSYYDNYGTYNGLSGKGSLITVKIYAPDDTLVVDTTYDLAAYDTRAERFDKATWVDHGLATYNIPADTKYGSYKVVLTAAEVTSTKRPTVTVAACDFKAIKLAPSASGQYYINSNTNAYLYVPSDATTFTVGTNSYLRILNNDYEYELTTVPAGSVVTPTSGEKDAFWALANRMGDFGPLNYITTLSGDVENFVYLSPDSGQFDIASYSTTSTIRDIKIVSDKWFDTSTLLAFGNSAITLFGAVTEEEKAQAIFRAIQMTTAVVNVQPTDPNSGLFPLQHIVNDFGFDWCDGLSRTMIDTWRALGNQAEKVYYQGHTVAHIYYEDSDEVERWHAFDNASPHSFVYNRDGFIASADDIASDESLSWFVELPLTKYPLIKINPVASWIHENHTQPPAYDRLFDLRGGESVTLYFDQSIATPWYTPTGIDIDTPIDFEHGPYVKSYGNAVWEYVPGVVTGTEIYIMDFPYIIAEVTCTNTGGETITVSKDDGDNWSADLTSVEGEHDYWIKVVASGDNATFQINTITQHNVFSLPQLWPVYNDITITASELSSELTLEVTYQWDDAQASNRQSIAEFESSPYTYEIRADGTDWDTVKCDWIKLEAVTRVGSGNRITTQENAPVNETDRGPDDEFDVYDIVEDGGFTPSLDTVSNYRTLLTDALVIDNFSVVHSSLRGLMAHGTAATAAEADVASALYHATCSTQQTKLYAMQALYTILGADCVPYMEEVITKDAAILGWTDTSADEWTEDDLYTILSGAASLILSLINDSASKELADEIATLSEQVYAPVPYYWTETKWGLYRSLGYLGDSNEVSVLQAVVVTDPPTEAAYWAAWSLGEIGTNSNVSDLETLIANQDWDASDLKNQVVYAIEAIGKLGTSVDGPTVDYLNYWDEDFRGVSAEALGRICATDYLDDIQTANAAESFEWVSALMDAAETELGVCGVDNDHTISSDAPLSNISGSAPACTVGSE